jgi:hypothetical protein
MGKRVSYPRYFVYGKNYQPPALYIRAINEHASFIMDPRGHSMHAHSSVDYWELRVDDGDMIETTREAIALAIERWNESEHPKLKPPD